MTRQLDVKPQHREQITRLLREHLPGVEVWAYGSRVNGRSHEGSDLDLVLRGPDLAKINTTQLAVFNEAVQESTIPFLVEARDWAQLPESFHREIEREYVVLEEGEERVARDEWPTMSLREAGISLIDCEHRTPPAAEHGYPYVAIPQVKDGRINLNGVRRITHEHFDEWTRKANPESFDIVLSRRCNPGETGFVSEGLKFALGQNLVLLRSDGTKVLKPFLRWLVRGPRWWEQVDKYINVGAIFDSLKCADIPNFSLPIPPLSEQRAITHILGTLDDKIELNRRMNETLEEMARTLFKSWFVDFDPVHAKAALRNHTANRSPLDWTVEHARAYLDGMDPSIAALFPDRFVDSELGEIPEGWGVGALDDMLELLSGGTPKTSVAEYWDGDIPWYTAKDAPTPSDIFVVETERRITQAGIENSAAKILPAGTTIITARGTVGRLACLGIPMTMNQTCYGIRGVQGYPDFFTYMNIKMTVNELQQRTHGTIFDTITRQTFELIDAIIPPPKLADKFETVVQPIMSHILSNLHESRALTALRNTLLPKLVSGDVRVGM